MARLDERLVTNGPRLHAPQHVGREHLRELLGDVRAAVGDEGEAVDVRVHDQAEIRPRRAHFARDAGEVLRERLGVVGEEAVRLSVEHRHVRHAEALQQAGQGDAADRVDAVHDDPEAAPGDGLAVDEAEVEDLVDVGVEEVLLRERAEGPGSRPSRPPTRRRGR